MCPIVQDMTAMFFVEIVPKFEQCLLRYPNETTTTESLDIIDIMGSEKDTDYCDVKLHCRYEEDVTTGDGARSYWFESNSNPFLFLFSLSDEKL